MRAEATASALPSPEARNHTAAERLRAPKVSVMRSGGGLGESRTYVATASSTSRAGWPGKSEAQWPSGPMPSMSTSNSPAPCRARWRSTPPRPLPRSARRPSRPSRARWPGRRRRGRAGRAGPGGHCGRRCRAPRSARRPTRRPRATSRLLQPGDNAAIRRWSDVGDGAAGEADLGDAAVGLEDGEHGQQARRRPRPPGRRRRRSARPGSGRCGSLTMPPASPGPGRWRRTRRPRRGGAAPRRAARGAPCA